MSPHSTPQPEAPVLVPASQLAPEVLRSLVESFVLREGTDYGTVEVSLAAKVDQVLRQIARQEICIVFDTSTESVSLWTQAEYRKNLRQRNLEAP